MDVPSECSVLEESVQDNELSNQNITALKETDVPVEVHSITVAPKSPAGGSPPTSKGCGLKKWRRIRRDFVKHGNNSADTGKVLKRDFSGVTNLTKNLPEIKQTSEGSVGSSNLLKNVGFPGAIPIPIPGSSSDSRFAIGSAFAFAPGTDSENSEDRSSKSSTAASAPKSKYDFPSVSGHAREKSRSTRNTNPKNLCSSIQRVPQGKGRNESSKKPRGERVKIEKQNSYSSMESDSTSVNFVPGMFAVTSNGKHVMSSNNYHGDEVQLNDENFSEEVRAGFGEGHVGDEDLLPEDSTAELSSNLKEDKSKNHASSADQDPLIEAIRGLQSVQEVFEKEIQKLGEIGNGAISLQDDFIQSSSATVDLTSTDPEVHGLYSSTQFDFEKAKPTYSNSQEIQILNLTQNVKILESELEEAKAVLKLKDSRIAELEAVLKSMNSPREESGTQVRLQEGIHKEMETELEGLFKQKIEAEIEYLAITKTMQNMKARIQHVLLEEQEHLADDQAYVLKKLGEKEIKASKVNQRTEEELLQYQQNILDTEEAFKMQSRVCKVTWCFLIQLVLLVFVVWLFVMQLSPRPGVVVPT